MRSKAPLGYVDLAEAAEITGYSKETIRLAAQSRTLKALQRVPLGQWYFLPADLRSWLGIDESAAS